MPPEKVETAPAIANTDDSHPVDPAPVETSTPLEECDPVEGQLDSPGRDEVAAILRPLTREQDADGQASGT